jgi:uncharacterized protein involved in exopolysaccharide biosynthesis
MVRRTLNDWVELLFRRSTTFLAVSATAFALVVAITYAWPPVYESTAKILVQDNRAQLLVSPQIESPSPQNPAIVVNPVNEQELNSEVELLTSRYLVSRAIEGLSQPPRASTASLVASAASALISIPSSGYGLLHDSPTVTARDEWIMKLERHLSAVVIKQSNVIEVNFTDHDAGWAVKFLSRLIDEYLKYHSSISHDPEAAKLFDAQSRKLADRLRAAEDRLRALQLQSGITSLPDQKQALVRNFSDLQMRYASNAAELASARQEADSLSSYLKQTPERIGKETKSVQDLALQQLKPQVLQLKTERAELASRYQPNSKRLRDIDAKLAAAEAVLNHEDHLEIQEKTTDLNPVYVDLESKLKETEANATALAAERQALEQQIEKARQQLAGITRDGLEIERFERDVATNSEAYLAYVRKSEEAHAAEALNGSNILNVSVAQTPTRPLRPEFPKVWLNLIAGFAMAMALGVLAAWWEETVDLKLYSPFEIARVSGISAVAVLRNERSEG